MNSSIYIRLTIEGTNYDNYRFLLSRPNLTIKEQIERIKQVLSLPAQNYYSLGRKLRTVCGHELVEIIRKEQYDHSLIDIGLKSEDSLFLLVDNPEVEGQDVEFIINLIIGEEEHEVCVSHPQNTVREQISSIKKVFELQDFSCGGDPVLYELYKQIEDNPEGILIRSEDEEGNELTFLQNGVRPGDKIEVCCVPIAGYACPIPVEMQDRWILINPYSMHS